MYRLLVGFTAAGLDWYVDPDCRHAAQQEEHVGSTDHDGGAEDSATDARG